MQAQKSWSADHKKLTTKYSPTASHGHRSIAQQVQNKLEKVNLCI